MAYRRSITIRSNLIMRRLNPSFGYVIRDENDDRERLPRISEDLSQQRTSVLFERWLFGGSTAQNAVGLGGDRYCLQNSIPLRMGIGFNRCMSSSAGVSSDKVINDVVGVLADSTMETMNSQAPVLSEIAIATADSWYPVAALQYVIDGVHCFTGLDWWASIALTTLLIRVAILPFQIHTLRANTILVIMKPRLEEIHREVQSKGLDPPESKRRMDLLFKENGITPFTPMKGMLVQGPVFISALHGIINMAEKVPSFKDGGVLWLQDLSTPDTLYILPVMAAFCTLIQVECNMIEGMESNPMGFTMKTYMRGMAVLTIPFTMNFPKAIFFYWITNNLFSLVYGFVIKRPEVKKYLRIPEIPLPPPGSAPQRPLTLFAAYKYCQDMLKKVSPAVASSEPPKLHMDKKQSPELGAIEKQVNGRKKKKRM